ncbi:MAG TPA: primosomal protein N', partial [Candidatus Limnocylindrales bacterium]|nr:primosomal protein N' [Candidatus Limnocylindrales bacterium]
ARWISERYRAPLGPCLWLWLPPGLTGKYDLLLELISEEGAKTALENELIALLKRRGSLRGRQVEHALPGKNWRAAADDLARAGAIRKDQVLNPARVRPKLVQRAAIAIPARQIEIGIRHMEVPSKQADLLEWVAADDTPIISAQALKSTGASKAHQQKLIDSGYLRLDSSDRLHLAMHAENVPSVLADMRKTDKVARILRVLAREHGAIDVSWLYAQTGATLKDLRRLEDEDLIILEEKNRWRDSLADQDFQPFEAPELLPAQRAVWDTIAVRMEQGEPGAFLLHGVTGSGKTEIYLRAIETALAQGKDAMFLVPEISLTPQTVRRVAARFPGLVAVVHSGLTDGERYDTWRRAREGLFRVVVGARSALYTPLPHLGLIILDEEHDHSYKQSPPLHLPYYDARRVAEEMMLRVSGTLLLGSATPDVDTYHRATRGEIVRLEMPERIMGHRPSMETQAVHSDELPFDDAHESAQALMAELPPVLIVDMRAELKGGNISIFSLALQQALSETLVRDEQAILFLNRRGQATYVFCRDCGYVVKCPRCEAPLTYHRHGQRLRCHRCGYSAPEPVACPACHSRRIKYFGAGTQQVEQAFAALFPQARTLRWDADTTGDFSAHDALLQRFINRQADVLIGTQMVTKGLDLPLVTLVGVISADVGLNLPDFRAPERTFQLLTQVAGRAGRGQLAGKVILQTYQPEHYAIQAAANHDYTTFYDREIAYRQELGYPPFRRLVRLLFRFPSEQKAREEALRAAGLIREQLHKLQMSGTEIIGPAPCFFSKDSDIYRWHLLLRGPDPLPALEGLRLPSGWFVDVDPVEVL